MLERFLSAADADRASRTLRKLAAHDIRPWALTGGVASEIHRLHRGCHVQARALNDLDFVTDSFDCIPQTLADDFLFRHVHPMDPPGKNMMQFVDPSTATRIDVFRAQGGTMSRTTHVDLADNGVRIVSLEDLAARAARLALDLAEGVATPWKHARDFLNLAELVDAQLVETAWQDHRKPKHPQTFAAAKIFLPELIARHRELLITPIYSRNPEELCPRCAATSAFKLADTEAVLRLLGYC